MSAMLRLFVTFSVLVVAAVAHGATSEDIYVLQANDIDPTAWAISITAAAASRP